MRIGLFEAVDAWIRLVVIGQQFCPFAAIPYEQDDILLEDLPVDPVAGLQAVARRAEQMSSHELPETVLLVADAGHADFGDFVDFVGLAETLLEEHFPGLFTIATFHPDFQFGDMEPARATHWIHQSPAPILQLLRKKSLAFAKTQVDREALLQANEDRAAALGSDFFASFRFVDPEVR